MKRTLLALLLLGSILLIKGLSIALNETIAEKKQLKNFKEYEPAYNDDNNDHDDFKYDGRIIGGHFASISNFPYQASLQQAGSHICGSSIISANVVISAAHCILEPWNTASYKVRVLTSQHGSGGQLLAVTRIIRHEHYSMATNDYDVALVRLVDNIKFPENVKPIVLAGAQDSVVPKTRLIVSGWGFTTEKGSMSSYLQYVVVSLLPQTTCVKSYEQIAFITDTMFCAGERNGAKDSCQGDSGGPLVGDIKGELKLVGIVSWGIGCAQKGYPGVYTNVSVLRPWIDTHIVKLQAD